MGLAIMLHGLGVSQILHIRGAQKRLFGGKVPDEVGRRAFSDDQDMPRTGSMGSQCPEYKLVAFSQEVDDPNAGGRPQPDDEP